MLPAGAVPDGTTITIQPIVGPVAENDSLGLEIQSSAGLAQPIDVVVALDDGDMQAPEQTVIGVQQDDGMWVAHHRTVDMAACLAIAGATGEVGAWDSAELLRPLNDKVLVVHNTATGYTRDWTVQDVHLGSSTVGLITIPTDVGATYMAPAVKPTPNPVAVRFTSMQDPTTSPDHTAFKARARPSALTIVGGMGYHVAATFHADYVEMPCPVAQTTIDDSFEFDLAEDSSGELHVVGITNHPTSVSNERFDTSIWTSADINSPPEVISVLDGSVTSIPGTQFVQVNLTGNSAVGGCHAISVDGMAYDYTGSPQPPMVTLGLHARSAGVRLLELRRHEEVTHAIAGACSSSAMTSATAGADTGSAACFAASRVS